METPDTLVENVELDMNELDPYSVDPFKVDPFTVDPFTVDPFKVGIDVKESDEESSEEEPDIEEINDKEITSNNKTTCISDELTALKEVFDEELCTSLLIGWYDACSKSNLYSSIKLDPLTLSLESLVWIFFVYQLLGKINSAIKS